MASESEFRFLLPDVLVGLSSDEVARRADQLEDRFILLDGTDLHVRSTVLVEQSDGTTMAFSAWLQVSEATAEKLGTSWDGEDYETLEFDAVLANEIPSWMAHWLADEFENCCRKVTVDG